MKPKRNGIGCLNTRLASGSQYWQYVERNIQMKHDWHPADIIAALRKKNATPADPNHLN